ncbi:hypothetical protein PHYPSEUDO_012490 [Phytophthora pseudosyringae]|uniref:Uncharacterized protein n=1 Tax=Phytophthora pseudosyringae TaxID=221518 RepID=A0A8T1WL53_9STRA|nr:hypothetical protein PHYPSEUDO_012490 [Phytophthora pseudosyringae]
MRAYALERLTNVFVYVMQNLSPSPSPSQCASPAPRAAPTRHCIYYKPVDARAIRVEPVPLDVRDCFDVHLRLIHALRCDVEVIEKTLDPHAKIARMKDQEEEERAVVATQQRTADADQEQENANEAEENEEAEEEEVEGDEVEEFGEDEEAKEGEESEEEAEDDDEETTAAETFAEGNSTSGSEKRRRGSSGEDVDLHYVPTMKKRHKSSKAFETYLKK